jgi:hypothetical protein
MSVLARTIPPTMGSAKSGGRLSAMSAINAMSRAIVGRQRGPRSSGQITPRLAPAQAYMAVPKTAYSGTTMMGGFPLQHNTRHTEGKCRCTASPEATKAANEAPGQDKHPRRRAAFGLESAHTWTVLLFTQD